MLAVVALVTVWAAGLQLSPPGAGESTDAARLGPEAGEPVPAYLARAGATLTRASEATGEATGASEATGEATGASAATGETGADGLRLGLVQLAREVDADTASGIVAGVGAEVIQAVYRVPLPRVQTAVRRLPLSVLGDGGPGAVAAAIRAAQTQAANEARAKAITLGGSGRAGRIAGAEAEALEQRCPCILALVVRADPPAWRAIAARPGVRVIELAPPGARPQALAVSPLLPEQREVVGPVPDDGPVG